MNDRNKKSLVKSGITGLIWNFGGSFVQILLQIIVIGVLSRLLTPQEFGVVAIIMIIVTFSELFNQMGIGTAVVQLPGLSHRHISLAYTLSLIIGIIIGALYYLAAPHAADFFNLKNADSAIKFFALFFPIRSFNSISYALLTREMKYSVLVKIGMSSYTFGTGLISIVLAYLNYGYWSLILGQFASLLISTIFLLIIKPPKITFRYDKEKISELLFFGTGHTLGSIFNYFAENADNIIVGRMMNTAALGLYSKAFQLLSIPASFFGGIFDKVLFPILSKRQEDHLKLSSFYLFSTSLCFAGLIPVSILIFANAELIVELLLGDQWGAVVLPLRLLILGLAFRFGTKINKSYLKSIGLIYRGAYYQFIFAALMITLCAIGGYYYDISGVAVGVFLATLLNYFQVSFRLYKKLNFSRSEYLKIITIAVLVNLPLLIISIIINYAFHNPIWIQFLLSILVYIPLMLIFLFHKKGVIFTETNKNMITQILNSLPSTLSNYILKFKFFRKYYE
ncbi:lipopolysaccharide biosynthesis protein [Zeaxanthinibacter sp. PT1]|uniref:lipopolysaccharide biosynthesis protein n=1 Tax=Zeaxanthinibacter TaxID=561554 RepID=UPI002349856D|nr:lipopolysaccharide biosynthesis protein [Zeaxanthinibacter sp. PT1]MDC6352778.1 lipopolysaccharide biosynthesis protein [Zeaxanthinibacter sp. PT1]